MRRLSLFLSLLLAGCSSGGTKPPAVPLLGTQLQQFDKQIVGQRFRTILDFETAADAAFVEPKAAPIARPHTGRFALPFERSGTVNISSLLFGLSLPAEWTLLGGYVQPATDTTVTATLIADGRAIASTSRSVPAGVWAFASVDLTTKPCQDILPGAKSIVLQLDAGAAFSLDDVLLVNNRRVLARAANGWTVTQSGLVISIESPPRPPVLVETFSADGTWLMEEVNPIRLRLHDATNRRYRTYFSDGRALIDGRADTADALIALGITGGRLDRETAGDANNDGFNERRGAYQIDAAGGRLQVRLTPSEPSSAMAVLEVRGLANEYGTVTVDGRLIESKVRLQDGTLLIQLPWAIERTTEVTVGVSGR